MTRFDRALVVGASTYGILTVALAISGEWWSAVTFACIAIDILRERGGR